MATEFYLLSIQGSVNGQYNEVVQCMQGTGVATNDTLNAGRDLVQAWNTSAKALWLAMFPASYAVDRLTARRAFPKPSATATFQYQFGAAPGTNGSDGVSFNLCPTVLLIPPIGTKSQGRTFLPIVPSGQITNNAYQSAYITAINNYFNALITGLAGSLATWNLAVYSRKLQSASLVVAISHSLKLGFQGRRRKPVGS